MDRGHKIGRSALVLALSALLGACAVIPESQSSGPLANFEQQTQKDLQASQNEVDVLQGPLSMEAAMARALKYNLDLRARQMEALLASGTYRASLLEMLPTMNARVNRTERDKVRQSLGVDTPTQDLSSIQRDVGVSWNVLDSAVAYFNTRQSDGRAQIAEQKRRKAMHALMQDVRNAFWRAAAAQAMGSKLRQTIEEADLALKASRQVEAERLRPPQEALAYQRQLVENIRLLEGIKQDLAPAEVELASLINLPLNQPIALQVDWPKGVMLDGLDNTELLENMALAQNGDVRDSYIQSQMAREETRKVMLRLFPSLNFNASARYDGDRYVVHHNWMETSTSLSFNLLNLVTVPLQARLAEAGVQLADHRRMITQMAVLTQVHMARMALKNSANGYARAQQMWEIDQRLLQQSQALQTALLRGRLETVSTQSNALLSEFRYYQALAQVQMAESRLQAALGQEMDHQPLSQSLEALTDQVRQKNLRISWSQWQPLTGMEGKK